MIKVNTQQISIITYHYVRDLEESRYPRIKGRRLDEFREQIAYLNDRYSVVRMDDLIASLDNNLDLPSNAALLTFDDGYTDHFTNVVPVLDSFGLQGSFFIPMRPIFEHKMLDVNKIHLILASAPTVESLLGSLYEKLDRFRDDFNLLSNDDYFKKLAEPGRFDGAETVFIKRMLQKELLPEVRSFVIDELLVEYVGVDEDILARELYLSPDQIAMMQRHGMHIGNHTYNHLWLNSLNESEQRAEIGRSLDCLVELGISDEKWSMCYPYGAYNETTELILAEMGCGISFSTVGQKTNLVSDSRYSLPRLDTNQLMDEMVGIQEMRV